MSTVHFATSRRNLIGGSLGAMAGSLFPVQRAAARSDELVVVGWGGAWVKALREVDFEPFSRELGVSVRDDGPPLPSKIEAMARTGDMQWDLIETDLPAILTLVKNGLVEPIDYTKLDTKLLDGIPGNLHQEYGLGSSVYSLNIVYNSKAFGADQHPHSWPEVWDIHRFSGGRTFNFGGGISPPLEVALLADGVDMDKLYPLDTERAWRSLDRIKPYVSKWFASVAQGVQVIAAGDAAVGCAVSAQAVPLQRQGAPIAFDFNQGKLGANYWALLKGSRNLELAHKFINFAIDPERQARMAKAVPYGPTNLDAFRFLTADEAAVVPTSPDNIKKQFWWDVSWWGSVGQDGKTQREKQAEIFAKWMLS